jgi:hypothetical protein
MFVGGGQPYWAFPFSKTSLVNVTTKSLFLPVQTGSAPFRRKTSGRMTFLQLGVWSDTIDPAWLIGLRAFMSTKC